VRQAVGPARWGRFRFIQGDIRELRDCQVACAGVDVVLHQAALGSVPRSIDDPIATHENNISGFLNMLVAVRDAGVRRFVYAASSASYGDDTSALRVESHSGHALSPYAVTKTVNELYADVFARCYGLSTIGLRYFNVFGPRQNPAGAYAAVIPRWIVAMLHNEAIYINGDGSTSRDFCEVDNAVQANLLAGMVADGPATGQVYNVALNDQTSLNELYAEITGLLVARYPHVRDLVPVYRDFRQGDVRFSRAAIDKARQLLGYAPTRSVMQGLRRAVDWYVAHDQVARLAGPGVEPGMAPAAGPMPDLNAAPAVVRAAPAREHVPTLG